MTNRSTVTATEPDAELVAESAANVGLGAAQAEALREEIEKRNRKREASCALPGALLRYGDAVTRLSEHTENKADAEAALDDYLLGLLNGDASRPYDVLDPCKPGELVRPAFLVDELFYRSRLHLMFGREGTNKTMLIIWALANLASEGRHTLLIEYEIDEDSVGVMLEEMGCDRPELRPFFHQVAPNHPFSRELLNELVKDFPDCEAVALDNAAEAIASCGGGSGGDEHTAKDTLTVLAPLRDLAHSENGPAVIVADHLPHSREHAARGSTAKGGLTDVAFQVETPHPVTRTKAGDIKLTCRKDRSSLIGKGTEIWHTVGDGAGGLPIKRIATPGERDDELTEDGATMIVRLEAYAESNPSNPWLSKAKVFEVCGLAKSRKRDAELQRLANDETQPIEQRTEPRGGNSAMTLYRYRKVDDDAAVLGL